MGSAPGDALLGLVEQCNLQDVRERLDEPGVLPTITDTAQKALLLVLKARADDAGAGNCRAFVDSFIEVILGFTTIEGVRTTDNDAVVKIVLHGGPEVRRQTWLMGARPQYA